MSDIEVSSPMLPQPLEVRQRIAEALRDGANALEHDGCPPSAELIRLLVDFLQTEEVLAEQMEQQAAEAELARQAAREEAARLKAIRAAQVDIARQRLQEFQNLSSQEPNSELMLQQQLAAQFEQLLPFDDEHPEESAFQALVAAEHPWTQLLRLVADGQHLSDEEWDRLSDCVRNSFDAALANAALRGRLSLTREQNASVSQADSFIDEPPTETPSETAIEPETASVPEAALTPTASSTESEEVASADVGSEVGSVFDELTESDSDHLRETSPGSRSAILPVTSADSEASETLHNALFESQNNTNKGDSSILRQSHHFSDPTGHSGELATEILAADPICREKLRGELIQALIFEGRSGLAFHLARCMEASHSPVAHFLPAWAIRAWTVGNAVLFPSGQLAGRLQEDFAQFNPKALQSGPPEHALALGLFIRAVALRPAVVAPATRAAHILRSFEMSVDSSQLYNYCMRVGSYGEKLQGLAPTTFKRTTTGGSEQESLRQLSEDIQFWLNESSSYSVRYSVTNPLFTRAHWSLRTSTTRRFAAEAQVWHQWQDTLQTAHRIIRNILQDRAETLAETRHEMDRLALLTTGDRGPTGLKANSEMRNYLLQTITFGQRWISLHNTAKTESFVPEDLGELRSEIERRHDAVADELRDMADRYPQPEVQMALGCLMLAMDQLRDLVNPDVPTEQQEPDARHLVHSELLKIPGLQFSSNWQPDEDPESLADLIVKYLADPNPDWITAVQLQLGQGNLDAAEKISTLPVWNRVEQAQLQTVLHRYRKQRRDELWRDLQETEVLIEEAARLQLFSEQDRAGFSARLERLRRGLSLSRHHAGDANEITLLRKTVERRRAREAALTRDRVDQLESPGAVNPPSRPKGWKMEF